jgi:hypothetical protein
MVLQLHIISKKLQFYKNWTGKGNVVPVHTMNTYRWTGGIAPLILNLGKDEGERSTTYPGCFTPRKQPQFPLNRRLGGHQN